jgi:ubiquitin thioesterase protein OTUB1
MSVPDAIKVFCDKMDSDYLIMYMRMLTSGYIKTNSFMFEGYIETETVDQFCQQEVDPIDKEADQVLTMFNSRSK